MKRNFLGNIDTKTQKAAMVEAMHANLGNVALAVKKVGVSRAIHYHWLEKDPEYKAAIDEIAEIRLDFAEEKLMALIEGLHPTAVIYFLNNQGNKRGYNRPDIGGTEVKIVVKSPLGLDGEPSVEPMDEESE